MMDTRSWRNCIEALYYLSIIAAIFTFPLDRSSGIAWGIALLVMVLVREIFDKTIGKDLPTLFEQRGLKFVEASLLLLLTIVVYWSYRETEIGYQLLLAALPILGIFYSLLKPEAKEE
jgi:uncharacterized membrane protein YkvI